MSYIVVDIEAVYDTRNVSQNDFREIIELSAYKLNDSYEIVGNFQTYIRPVYHSSVPKKISKLTGLTYETVMSGDTFDKSVEYFKEWAGPDAVFLSWGQSDRRMMEVNCNKHCVTSGWFSSNHKDLQHQYDTLANKDKETSLSNAILESGYEFMGNKHCALDDAFNTAVIMQDLYKGQNKRYH